MWKQIIRDIKIAMLLIALLLVANAALVTLDYS